MKIKIILFAIILLFFNNSVFFAHEGKNHNKKMVDTTIMISDSVSQIDTMMNHDKHFVLHQTAKYEIEMPDMIFEHPHNKIVHFTVALSIVAFIFTLLNFKWQQFDLTIKLLVLISAIVGVISYLTGSLQAEVFYGEPIEWVVQLHKIYGIISAITLWVWLIFLFTAPLKKYAWIIGAIIFVLISVTGFYGGVIATS